MTAAASVLAMLNRPSPRVGYALTAHGPSHYAAYAESPVPASRHTSGPPNSASPLKSGA